MTRRERLRRCYFNLDLDRPAVYSRTLFPVNDSSYDELKTYLHTHTELKPCWDSTRFESDYSFESSVEPYSQDFEPSAYTPL
ncbi:MAG: hypothetical protein KAX05_14400 [Bacteroidales bacterium]|nr:hypothetical protein [Bacteroidales bacterium]